MYLNTIKVNTYDYIDWIWKHEIKIMKILYTMERKSQIRNGNMKKKYKLKV